jgi:type IV pilus assembly protein PilO
MTFSEEFDSNADLSFGESANYPTAFGLTLTPKISGILLGVLGILGTLYILMTMVMPVYQNYQKLKADEQAKADQVAQLKTGDLSQKLVGLDTKLQQAKALKSQVLALFASEKTRDTLLLDLNKLIRARGAKLLSFQPNLKESPPINDGSLGPAANNKLKRQSVTLEIEGDFAQTQAVLRDIERLQPLLLIKDLNTSAATEKIPMTATFNQGKLILQGKESPRLKTALRLDVIMPLSQEELAKLAPPPPAPPAK